MANPQKEDGYTAIANEIVEAIYKYPLSGHEFRMLLLIIRKTYGFQKTEDAVSLSQMMKALSLSKTRCSQVINKLQLQKIVTVTENINGIGKKYRFNKNFDQWATVHTRVNRYTKVKSTVTVLSNLPLHKSVSTKETITKETITKERGEVIFPEWLPKNTFQEYITLRKSVKHPLPQESYPRFFKKLKKLADTSNSTPEEILDQSITNGWYGIFAIKKEGNNGSGNATFKRQIRTERDAINQAACDEADILAKAYYAKHPPANGDTQAES